MAKATSQDSIKLEPGWKQILTEEFQKPYMKELKEFLISEKRKWKVIYPPLPLIFNAFNQTPWNKVKVVILGQDPYHNPWQAHWLAFSVPEGVPLPPSLQNIFKELHNDLGIPIPQTGNLTKWAKQWVLLLNPILTVEGGKPASHRGKGWEQFTDAVIQKLSDLKEGLVFVLWGNYAKEKEYLIDHSKHFVIKGAHPSPLSASRGFFGTRPFSKINLYLISKGKEPIDWRL